MRESGPRYIAATGTAEANEVRRRKRRVREQRIATYSSLAVLLLVAAFFMARAGAFGEWAVFGLGNRTQGDGGSASGEGQGLGTGGSAAGQSGLGGSGQAGDSGGEHAGEEGAAGERPGVGRPPGRAPLEQALKAKGLYLTMDSAGTPSTMAPLVTFIREHDGLDCMVIDVKDNSGRVPTEPPEDIPALPGNYSHFPALIDVLRDEGFYMIARVVAFQDPHLAKSLPERAIRNSDGSLWRDRDGRLWLNPYDQRNWEYVRDISLWAVEMGFDEIQLDYVRFPDSAQGLEETGTVLMPGSSDYANRGEAIAAFLRFMDAALDGRAYLSADIFGFVTIALDDMGIGQKLEEIADCVDFICPMVYPSHYFNPGIYGFEQPEAHPYEVVFKAMDEAIQRTDGLRSKIRPWLQDFSMRIRYGPDEVQGQIRAVFEHDIETYMLWNPANMYTGGVKYDR